MCGRNFAVLLYTYTFHSSKDTAGSVPGPRQPLSFPSKTPQLDSSSLFPALPLLSTLSFPTL